MRSAPLLLRANSTRGANWLDSSGRRARARRFGPPPRRRVIGAGSMAAPITRASVSIVSASCRRAADAGFHATVRRARMRPMDRRATASGGRDRLRRARARLARDVRWSRSARRRSRFRPRGRDDRRAVRHSNSPRRRFLGDFLATRCRAFGLLEPNLALRPSVYGTEGQRFESSRARSISAWLLGLR
jgi:hypothetical protein